MISLFIFFFTNILYIILLIQKKFEKKKFNKKFNKNIVNLRYDNKN